MVPDFVSLMACCVQEFYPPSKGAARSLLAREWNRGECNNDDDNDNNYIFFLSSTGFFSSEKDNNNLVSIYK